MIRKRQYNDYLKKSFIQYAIVIIFAIMLLITGFFAYYHYISVIRQNEISNEKVSSMFEEEYRSYRAKIVALASEENTAEVVDNTPENITLKRELSESLYSFLNNSKLKGYYAVLNKRGEIILSNLYRDNQRILLESVFLRRTVSRLKENEIVESNVNDLEFFKEQDCIYSFGCPVKDAGIIKGYLLLFIRENEIADFASSLNEEIIIMDHFDNTVFSSFALPKDPGEKMPDTKIRLKMKDKDNIEINGVRMYVRMYHMPEEDIKIYTLTSAEKNLQMMSAAAVFFLSMASIIIIFACIMARLYTRLNEKTVSELMRNLEVKNLEEQFNPHFVYNVMESVRFQIDEDPHKAQEMLLAFSTLMRYSINHGQTKVRLETDIDYLNDFLMLQKIRYNNMLHFEFSIDDELLDCLVPKLILQPIVENSIKHAYIPGQKLNIDIRGESCGENIILKVVDDGRGMDGERLEDISGSFAEEVSEKSIKNIGLYHVQKIIHKLYGEKCGITIESKENTGTTVTIRIPYEQEEDDA